MFSFISNFTYLSLLCFQLNRDETLTLNFDSAADKTYIVSMDSTDGNSEPQAVSVVKAAMLDILVFCDIGMEPATYFLASQRLVPIQIVFWGHPFTSGIQDTIDYYILPAGAEEPGFGAKHWQVDPTERYQEQLVRFSTIGSFYDHIEDPSTFVGVDESLTGGVWPWLASFEHRISTLRAMVHAASITLLDGSRIDLDSTPVLEARLYACPQHCGKFHPDFDAALVRILELDPSAMLLLRDCGERSHHPIAETPSFPCLGCDAEEEDPSFSTRLSERENWRDLSSRVLVVSKQLPLAWFLRMLGAAHVALEPFPFPASITTLDAFTVRCLKLCPIPSAVLDCGPLCSSVRWGRQWSRTAESSSLEEWPNSPQLCIGA
jgi:protein O-GlcNAc transferase